MNASGVFAIFSVERIAWVTTSPYMCRSRVSLVKQNGAKSNSY